MRSRDLHSRYFDSGENIKRMVSGQSERVVMYIPKKWNYKMVDAVIVIIPSKGIDKNVRGKKGFVDTGDVSKRVTVLFIQHTEGGIMVHFNKTAKLLEGEHVMWCGDFDPSECSFHIVWVVPKKQKMKCGVQCKDHDEVLMEPSYTGKSMSYHMKISNCHRWSDVMTERS